MKRIAVYVVSYGLVLSVYGGNISETKEAKVSVNYRSGIEIVLNGRETYFELDSWEGNTVEILARVEFKGKENGRVRDFLDNFEQLVNEQVVSRGSEININADHDEPNKVQIGGKNLGVQVSYNEDDLEISYFIKVPKEAPMSIKNSYDRLNFIGDHDGKLEIEIYSGRLRAKNVGNLSLNLKYGTADIISADDLEAEIYEQELNVGELGKGRISTKYSKLEFREIKGELNLDSYESRIESRSIGLLSGELKYGSIDVEGSIEEINLRSIYELEVVFGSSNEVIFSESKYSDITAETVGNFILTESYEDNIEVGTLSTIIGRSKYTDYDIRLLENSFRIDEMYEGEINVLEMSKSASLIFLNGKYVNAYFNMGQREFKLIANIQYGDVSFPREGMERQFYVKDGDQLEIESKTPKYTDGDLTVEVKGYELEVDLDY